MRELIGFAGHQGSGKDSCADILVEGRNFVKFAFADAVKTSCKALFDLSDDQLWGDSKNTIDERYGQSPRQLMQKLGTDFVRQMVRQSFWIDKFAAWYEKTTENVVISDVRFQDEVDIIRKLGGKVYLVQRPSHPKQDFHSSEKSELLDVDNVIANDGSLVDLSMKVEKDFLRET